MSLGSQGGVQFPERPLVPDEGVGASIDRLGDRGGRGGRQVAVLDRRGGRRALQQVAERRHRFLGSGQAGLQPGQMGGDQLVAGLQSGAVRTAWISSSGMSRSRNRRITWAVPICAVA